MGHFVLARERNPKLRFCPVQRSKSPPNFEPAVRDQLASTPNCLLRTAQKQVASPSMFCLPICLVARNRIFKFFDIGRLISN